MATSTLSPRWFYAFLGFIQRLPIPVWLLGLLVTLVGSLALHLEAWHRGLLPNGAINSYLITLSLFPVAIIGTWMLLNQRARIGLTAFFKNSNKAQGALKRVLTDFISLPSGLATVGLVLGTLIGYLNYRNAVTLEPLASQLFPAHALISFLLVGGIGSMFVLRAVRQAVILRRLYSETEVNIFNPTPLYALSRYASESSLAPLLLIYLLILFSLPAFLFTTEGLIESAILIGATLALFFAPLSSINQRMREEKDRVLSELGQDLDEMYARLHKAARSEAYAQVSKMRDTISSLKESWEHVKKIPTWPWEPQTLRNLLTPLLLPVLVYLVQRFFGSLFGF